MMRKENKGRTGVVGLSREDEVRRSFLFLLYALSVAHPRSVSSFGRASSASLCRHARKLSPRILALSPGTDPSRVLKTSFPTFALLVNKNLSHSDFRMS